VILLTLLFGLYTVIVHKPLQRVLGERRNKTEGAVEKAQADIAAAEARTTEYEQRLREARATLFRSQEARRQAALQARTAAIAEARKKAQAQVQAARQDIELDKEKAKWGLQRASVDAGSGNCAQRAATGGGCAMKLSESIFRGILRGCGLALLGVALAGIPVPLCAQEQPTQQEKNVKSEPKQDNFGRQLARESREAAEKKRKTRRHNSSSRRQYSGLRRRLD